MWKQEATNAVNVLLAKERAAALGAHRDYRGFFAG
jgi:hypothetical protein